jgi:2-polyprenyl-3-methyl-5-hydroxy-6-metoxy-1,4-benzoquinol methylase
MTAWSALWPQTRLRRCAGCGTVLNDRAGSRQEEESRYGGDLPTVQDEQTVAASQWQWMKRALLPGDPRRLAVLDIGCGGGAFLRAASEDGARVAGIELSRARAAACQRLGLMVQHGSLFDIGLPPGPWDVITMWDVLDHLEHPDRAIQLAAEALSPEGVLVARGRNGRLHAACKAVFARLRPVATSLRVPDLSVVHRWGLRPGGYVELMRRAGLEGIQLHPGIPTPGDRHGEFGCRFFARTIKGSLGATGAILYAVSARRFYPFTSVLITGRKALSSSVSPQS